MTKTYNREEFIQRIIKDNNIPEKFFLFAGKNYVPKKHPFTIYQEFDNLTEFLYMRQVHIQNGLNVLCCAF